MKEDWLKISSITLIKTSIINEFVQIGQSRYMVNTNKLVKIKKTEKISDKNLSHLRVSMRG